jgi:uncharacterized protein (TIGR03067 family)
MYLSAALVLTARFALIPDPVAIESARLQGTWAVVATEYRGRGVSGEGLNSQKVVVDGDIIAFHDGGKSTKLRYKLHATREPRAIDFFPQEGKEKGPILGIYELDGDTLRLCWDQERDKGRPTDFLTRPGSELNLWVLKRVKKE